MMLMVTAAPLTACADQGPPPPPPPEDAEDAGTDGADDDAGTSGGEAQEDAEDDTDPATRPPEDTEEAAAEAAERPDEAQPIEEESDEAQEPVDDTAEPLADTEPEETPEATEEAVEDSDAADEAVADLEEAGDEAEPPPEEAPSAEDAESPPEEAQEEKDRPKTPNGRDAAGDRKAEEAKEAPPETGTDRDRSKIRRLPPSAKERMEEIRKLREQQARERQERKSSPTPRPATPPKPKPGTPTKTTPKPPTKTTPKPPSKTPPLTTPKPSPTRGVDRVEDTDKKADDSAKPELPEKESDQPVVVTDDETDIPDPDVPPEARTYVFSIDGEYSDLINTFSRMSGLGVIGEPPKGQVTLKSTEKMDFKAALNRIRLLLFKHPENYWLVRTGNLLEITQVKEVKRFLELTDIYQNVASFRAANRDENDLVMLWYTPERGSVDDLTEVRDFLPDYVLSATLADPTMNTMSIFALVKDINKFLDLVKMFEEVGNQDPRKIKAIPVQFLAPSEALDLLGQLMDLSGGGAAGSGSRTSSSRRTTPTVARGTPRGIDILPDDAQSVLIVRALQSEIDEIERILPYIDVAPETDFNPVIIPLKHVTTDTIMNGLRSLLSATGTATPPPGTSGSKSTNRRPPRVSAPSAVSDEEVTVVPEPRTNKLIVIGTDAGVARVRQMVALLDVEGQSKPTIVELAHADPAVLAAQVTNIVQGMRAAEGGQAAGFSATSAEAANAIILIGQSRDVALAEELIHDWDKPGSEPTLHRYRLRYAKPSDVASMLSRLESGKPQPAARPQPKTKGKSRTPSRRTVTTAGQFIGDDVNGLIYVTCTDDEWEQEYRPQIEELDEDANRQLATHTIEITDADPQEIIDTISVVLSDQGDVPQMVAVAKGILVIGANQSQIEQMEALADYVDQKTDDLERRMFELEYAEPEQVRQAILTMLSGQPARAARRAPTKGKQPSRPAPAAAGEDIRIVEVNGALLVAAPPDKMEDIAELVAQLDVDTEVATELRVYPLPPSVDVQAVADGLTRLVGGAAMTPRRQPARKGAKGAQPAAAGGPIMVIPQPASHRLLVSAPVEDFPRIEETIQTLASEGQIVETVYDFIDVEGGNADAIVPVVEPILQAKINELIARGELPGVEVAAQKGKGGPARQAGVLTIQADPRNDRIVISAPQVIVAEARALIGALDRPADDTEQIIRTIRLEKTDPEEMASTINSMLTGQRRAPSPRRQGRGERRGRPLSIEPGGDSVLDVSITPAPGGQAVVLVGPARDVEEVEGWIRDLDETATSPGKIIKVYDLKEADAEQVADTLMAVVDTAGAQVTKQPKAKATDPLFDDWDVDLTIKRTGKDLYISADTLAGTMLVAATPAKMREVDDIITLFVGDEETAPIVEPAQPVPYMTYELQTVKASDAVYTLENLLDVLWVPPDDKPKVDYIPFTNMLVIKGKPNRFKEIEDLIVRHVDTGTGPIASGRAIIPTPGTRMTAEDAAKMLMLKLIEQGFDVEINQLNPEEPIGRLEEVNPCILPPSAFDAVNAAVLSVAGQANEDDQKTSADAVLQDFAEALKGQEETAGATSDEATANDDAVEKPKADNKVHIRWDNKRGVLVVEGPHGAIQGAEGLIEDIKEELKDLPELPDIRIFRLKHVDPVKAADVLDTMFNNKQQRAEQQQVLRMQQQLARQQQAQQRQQQRQQQQQGKEGQQRPGEQPDQQEQQIQVPQMPQMALTAYPNPRDRTIIIRAATEAFPSIIDLLATIDKEPTAPLDYKIFTLTNLVAAEVEEQIRAMLKMDTRGTRSTAGRRGQPGGAQVVDEMQIQMETPGGEAMAVSGAEITITSNATTNTLFVMAPKEAMDLVERFINDMEQLERPDFVTKTYDLKNADAIEAVSLLEKMFEASSRGRSRKGGPAQEGFDPTGINAPTFLADSRTNSIIVRALEIDLPKIEPLIEQLDVAYDADAIQVYRLINADAEQVARTLEQIYGAKGGRGKSAAGADTVRIVANPDANAVFVAAPPNIQTQISEHIAELEQMANAFAEPKAIKVALGTPSEIAKTIDQALGGAKGKSTSRVRIIGDDVGKQLLVFAPEEMMPRIESLVQKLDQPPTDVDIRIYPLEHAQAKEILQGLNEMVRALLTQLRSKNIQVDIFSATADERSNSLVVMGGPMTFMMVEKVLKDLDIPPRDPTQVVTAIYQLINASAQEVARNINSVYGQRKEKGVDPPKAEANPSGNVVLVRGTKAQVDEIYEQVIKPLEESMVTTAAEFTDKRIPLTYAQADEVAQSLNQFFNEKFRAIKGVKNIKPSELIVSITPEVNSNSLLVTASDTNMALIEELLPEMDREDIGTKSARTPEIYVVKYADAGAVANAINSAFRVSGKQAERDRVQAVVEWATQSVVVIASADNQEEIRTLIEGLDQDTGKGSVRNVYRLQEARASDVARIIDQTLRASRGTTRKGQLPVSVVANDALNSLVIAGTQQEYDDILPLVQELDQQPTEITGLEPRVYVLKYADPASLIGTVQSAFPKLPGQRPEDTVKAAYTWGTAALVVSASPENHERVAKLLGEIDIEGAVGRKVHLIALEFANADDLASKLGQLFGRTTRQQRDQQPISFTSEPGSNRLLVYANDQEMEEIRPLIESLDIKPEFEKNRVFKSFQLTYAEAWEVKGLIDESFRVPTRNASPRDLVTTMAAWASNSVVVTASPEKMEQVGKLIEEVDQKDAGGRDVHVLNIKHADPEGVNRSLNDIFGRSTAGRRGQTIFIAHPEGSDTILVRANENEFAQIKEIVEQLDISEAEIGGEIKVIPLQYTDATETAEILQEYLRKPGTGGRGRGGELAGDVRISTATATNALIISGDKEEIEHLTNIIAQIDVEIEDAVSAPKIIRLQYAQASEIQPSLAELFEEQRGRGGRGGRGGSTMMPPVIVAEDGTNSLIIRASAMDYRQIENLVAEMDREDAVVGNDIKIIPLDPAMDAAELADELDRLYSEVEKNRGRGRRGGTEPQRVAIAADVRTNSLILMGPRSKFDEIETLARDMEALGPKGGRMSTVIRIKQRDPEEIKRLLDQMIEEKKSGSTGRGGRRR